MDAAVAAVFEGYPEARRQQLLALRETILATAAATPGVGKLQETLKWGQISYLTPETKSGTTLRIDTDPASGQPTIYVNCQTDLVERYRALYPETFKYQGTRAVVIDDMKQDEALHHVVALALTYHQRKKS